MLEIQVELNCDSKVAVATGKEVMGTYKDPEKLRSRALQMTVSLSRSNAGRDQQSITVYNGPK